MSNSPRDEFAASLRARLSGQDSATVTDLAQRLSITRPALSNVLNGNAALSIPLALQIERIFGLEARALLVRQLDIEIEAAKSEST